MKRVALFITIGIILLVAGSLLLYQSLYEKKITPWSLIGSDAVIVIELTNLNSLKHKLEKIPSLNNIIGLSEGISIAAKSKLFQEGKVYMSVHPTSRDDFGFLIYNEIDYSRVSSAIREFKNQIDSKLELKTRVYNGVEINEYMRANKLVFCYALIDEILVISESSFLLEGVLKLRTSPSLELFQIANPSLFKLPTLKSDEGNVYLNISHFIEFSKLFLKPESVNVRQVLNGASLVDFKVGDDGLLLNGFLVSEDSDFISLFDNQEPQSMDMAHLISNRVAVVKHYGISDPLLWFENQQKLLTEKNIKSLDSLNSELARLSVSVESIRKSIGNQFTNCYLTSNRSEISIVKIKKERNAISIFDELSSKISEQKRDSLYVENYAGYNIKLIDYRNFLYQLLYPMASPSEQSYFVLIDDNLIISESVELIKGFIDDIDAENTWGKSVDWSKFMSNTLQEANVNLFFDGKLTSVFLRNQFNAKWRAFFDSTYFLGIDKGSAQLSRLESNYYLNASLQFSNRLEKDNNKNLVRITNRLDGIATLPLKVVKSHVSKEIELVVQDSLNNLYLLSKDLKARWKLPVMEKIKDDIEQVDFFSNGKQQYFFVTNKAIHIVDRLGRYVDGFPKQIDIGIVEYSTVVDYDRSKRYRYLIANSKGNLLLTNKNGDLLDGWNPRVLDGKLLSSAKHYRVLGKDYFIAISQNGKVSLMNRRGEMIRGFPLSLGVKPSGDFSITIGNSIPSSSFTVVSTDGLKIQFGLDGNIVKKDVMLKKAASSRFSLVKSIGSESYVFFRVDPGKIALIDSEGNTLFEIENQGSLDWKLIYLENSTKDRFYCLYDQQQNFSYFFNPNGRLLLTQPLESTLLPTLHFDEKTKALSIYNVNNSSVSKVLIGK